MARCFGTAALVPYPEAKPAQTSVGPAQTWQDQPSKGHSHRSILDSFTPMRIPLVLDHRCMA